MGKESTPEEPKRGIRGAIQKAVGAAVVAATPDRTTVGFDPQLLKDYIAEQQQQQPPAES